MRRLLVTLVVIISCAAFGMTQRAEAAIWSATASAATPKYSGACPVTITFNGTIAGSNGTPVIYVFSYYDPASKKVINLSSKSGAIGKSLSLAVTDSLFVTPAHAGSSWVQLTVKAGTQYVASTKTAFSVTCTATPTPSPSTSPVSKTTALRASMIATHATSIQMLLPAPTGLTMATDKQTCAQYAGPLGSFACSIGLSSGKLVLVWRYPSTPPVDGYRIYKISSGGGGRFGPILVTIGNPPIATQTNPQIPLEVLDSQSGCFAVTAYAGNNESPQSQPYCVGGASVGKIVTLYPSIVATGNVQAGVSVYKSLQDNMYDNNSMSWGHIPNPVTWVGWSHDVALTSNGKPSQYLNSVFRGYLYFDVSSLAGHKITKAVLNLHSAWTSFSTGQTCLAKYGESDHLWKPGDPLFVSNPVDKGYIQGPNLSLDVTPIVTAWTSGAHPNNGFALDSEFGFISVYAVVAINDECFTSFDSPTLTATYY